MRLSTRPKGNRSKKHHYLPRHYLRGFVDSGNCFFLYDKLNDKILPNPLTPDAAFFENNLNTVFFPMGGSSDYLENLYALIENESWGPLDNIRNSTNKTKIRLLDKMRLFLFLLFLHWRLPGNIKYVEELSKDFFVADNDLCFFTLKSKSGENVPKEVLDLVRNSAAFKKSSKLMLPFAPFYDGNWSERIEKWRFLYTGDSANWYLVGDNPIITKGDNDHDPVNCLNEFVFPVSGRILLVNTDQPIKRDMPPEFVVQVNVSIIERAQRFAACQNRDFLEALTKYYRGYVNFKRTDVIISDMFDMLKQ
ncbi:MAG: DUF4238 domain-containing protein [Candidatus Aminicenantales bacterium]|jgi:hypothetical protein